MSCTQLCHQGLITHSLIFQFSKSKVIGIINNSCDNRSQAKYNDCCHWYSATQKIRKDLNEFVTKLHDIPSKVENIHVCLKKFVSDAIEEKVESVEADEKNSDTVPMIEGRYSVYMYDGKLGMHVPSHFDLPVNTRLFSAWKL